MNFTEMQSVFRRRSMRIRHLISKKFIKYLFIYLLKETKDRQLSLTGYSKKRTNASTYSK